MAKLGAPALQDLGINNPQEGWAGSAEALADMFRDTVTNIEGGVPQGWVNVLEHLVRYSSVANDPQLLTTAWLQVVAVSILMGRATDEASG